MLNTLQAKLETTATAKIGDQEVTKVGHLFVDHDTPIEMIKTMLFDFIGYVAQLESAVKAQQAAVQVTETPAEADPVAAAPVEQPPAEATA